MSSTESDTLTPAELESVVLAIAQKARGASLELAARSTEEKNRALQRMADLLDSAAPGLAEENRKDVAAGTKANLSAALLDRLKLTPERIHQMAEGVRQVAALPDPVGEEMERLSPPNGLDIRKIRVPLGVVGIIYESRPNVTVDCAALCLKAGNASILRGGKEAFYTNTALARLIAQAIKEAELPAGSVQIIPTTDRAALLTLLRLDTLVQCLIPRGGEGLIRFVAENATIPVIKHYKGVCCVYVDKAADLDQAVAIAVNAKCQRPGVCNAAEKLLVHRDIAARFLPLVGRALAERKVELRVDAATAEILSREEIPSSMAGEEDWTAEYLDLILAIKIVPSLDAAIEDINTYGSGHSDAILTTDEAAARRFLTRVDSATVYWNASTRFTDGYEFGLGAEIGISTDKLHARGPMGLKELCSYKYVIYGHGELRA